MKFDDVYSTLLERSGQEMLDDPQNPTGDAYHMADRLVAKGGKHLGIGAYGNVYYHPSWDYVMKVFETSDECYLRFIRFAQKHPEIAAFPKVIQKPKAFVPSYIRSLYNEKQQMLYLEKLNRLSGANREAMNTMPDTLANIFKMFKLGVAEGRTLEEMPTIKGYLEKLIDTAPAFKPVVDALMLIFSNPIFANCYPDLHDQNLMERPNGEIVITDPMAVKKSSAPPELSKQRSDKARQLNRKGLKELPGGMTFKKFYNNAKNLPDIPVNDTLDFSKIQRNL